MQIVTGVYRCTPITKLLKEPLFPVGGDIIIILEESIPLKIVMFRHRIKDDQLE